MPVYAWWAPFASAIRRDRASVAALAERIPVRYEVSKNARTASVTRTG